MNRVSRRVNNGSFTKSGMKSEPSYRIQKPMQQSYRLLRDNKESGPFELEDLVQIGLKPLDLIWVEGQSNNWCPAHEFEKSISLEKSPEQEAQVNLPSLESTSIEASLAKEPIVYIRFPEERSENSLPDNKVNDDSVMELIPAAPDERRGQVPALIPMGHLSELSGSGYSRSLDDIRNENARWRQAQRTKRRAKPIPVIASIIVLTLLSFGIINNFRHENVPVKGLPVSKTKLDPSQLNRTIDEPISFNPAGGVTHPLQSPSLIEERVPKNNRMTQLPYSGTTKEILVPSKKTVSGISINPAKRKNLPAPLASGKIENLAVAEIPTKPTTFSTPSSQDFVLFGTHPVTREEGVAPFHLTFKNNSDQLRFAAVDVIYKKKGTITSRETLYFNKVAPHQSLTRSAPGNKGADEVIYKLGLVSTEDGSLFYAQQ